MTIRCGSFALCTFSTIFSSFVSIPDQNLIISILIKTIETAEYSSLGFLVSHSIFAYFSVLNSFSVFGNSISCLSMCVRSQRWLKCFSCTGSRFFSLFFFFWLKGKLTNAPLSIRLHWNLFGDKDKERARVCMTQIEWKKERYRENARRYKTQPNKTNDIGLKWEFAIVSLFETYSNLNFGILLREVLKRPDRKKIYNIIANICENEMRIEQTNFNETIKKHRDTFLPISNLLMCILLVYK